MAIHDDRMYNMELDRMRFRNAAARVAMGVAWAYRHWPENEGPRSTQSNRKWADEEVHPDEKHALYRGDNNRLECRICRKYAISRGGMAKMLGEKCSGSTFNLIHPSHSVRTTAGVTWCTKCGSFATRRPRLLAKECNQRPRTEPQRNILRRLTLNMAPTTANYLADVAIANGGLRGADNSLMEEVAWRRPSADTSIGIVRARGGASSGATMARTPTGRYARLPGGHLFEPRASAANGEGGSTRREIVNSSVPLPSDTPSGPGAPAAHPGADGGGRSSGGREGSANQFTRSQNVKPEDLCTPSDGSVWTRRLLARYTTYAKKCNNCEEPTRTTCKGCLTPMCTRCARERRRCRDGQPQAAVPSPTGTSSA